MIKYTLVFFILISTTSCQKNEKANFTFKRLPDSCDEYVAHDTIYKRDKTYIEKEIVSDSLVDLDIKFINPCCMEFSSSYKFASDTLYISYKQSNDVMCSCLCCYSYNIQIKDLHKKPKYISVYETNGLYEQKGHE